MKRRMTETIEISARQVVALLRRHYALGNGALMIIEPNGKETYLKPLEQFKSDLALQPRASCCCWVR